MCSYKSLITDDTDLTKLINNGEKHVDLISLCLYIEMHEIRNIISNPYDLNVIHLNMCSVMNKQEDLKEVLNNLQNKKLTIDIIFLCETYLNECMQKWLICLNTIWFIKIGKTKNGRVATLLKEHLKYTICDDLSVFQRGGI